MKGALAVHLTERFQRDYDRLPADIRLLVDECIQDFDRDPLPLGRRAHSVTPRGKKPTVFTMDVTSNKSHKLSFHVVGNVAMLRRVGTHRELDRWE